MPENPAFRIHTSFRNPSPNRTKGLLSILSLVRLPIPPLSHADSYCKRTCAVRNKSAHRADRIFLFPLELED